MDNTCSKTDKPMVWNKPPQSQLDKYHKGCAIRDLFPSKSGSRDVDETFTFKNVENVTDMHLLENSPFIEMVKAEKKCTQ